MPPCKLLSEKTTTKKQKTQIAKAILDTKMDGQNGGGIKIQSNLVISNSKGLTETLRDIRTSTYQSWESEETQ